MTYQPVGEARQPLSRASEEKTEAPTMLTVPPAAPDAARVRSWALGIIATLAILWMLKATMWIVMPLTFAYFVALVIHPIESAVQGRMPKGLRWIGRAVAMALVLLVIAVFLGGIYFVARNVAQALPEIVDQLGQRVAQMTDSGALGDLRQWMQRTLGVNAGNEEATSGLVGQIGRFAQSILGSVTAIVSMGLLIFFFTLLMLTEGSQWCEKLARVADHEDRWMPAVRTAAQSFRWYLLVRTLLGVLTAGLYGLWLLPFGVDLIPVWIILTFLLNYIPTIGSLLSGLLPFGFALATKDFGTAMIIGAGLFLIEQVMGNYVDPRLQGREMALSPLVLLVSILIWGFLWGPAGTLIAVPLMALAIIIMARIEPLRPIALLLSNSGDYESLDASITPR